MADCPAFAGLTLNNLLVTSAPGSIGNVVRRAASRNRRRSELRGTLPLQAVRTRGMASVDNPTLGDTLFRARR